MSHSQKGASSRSESSGESSRPRRGVGGGVGSTHCSEITALFSTLELFSLEDTGTIITLLVLVDDGLACLSRDGTKLFLIMDDAAKEEPSDPLAYEGSGDFITLLSGFDHVKECPM